MKFTSNNLTFVIVTFNSRKVIYDCLNSLPKDFNKLIVENSFDEKLKKELEQNYDRTEVILSNNIGMGAGNNLGIIKSNTQYVYVLNPDVLLENDTISNINKSMSELENFAILSPLSDNPHYPNYRLNFGKAQKYDSKIISNVEEIDGLIATGGTAEAASRLIEISKGKVGAFIFVINLFDLGGSDKLIKEGFKVENLIEFPGH